MALNNTVYVRGIDEHVRLEMLTATLTDLFSLIGPVIEVNAKGNVKAKGQAFVVMESASDAARAIEELQEFELWGKPMSVDFARTRSDATVQKEAPEEFETHKRRRLAEKERKQALSAAATQKLKRPTDADPTTTARPSKKPLKSSATGTSAVIPDEYLPPNKILFIQNLPPTIQVEELEAVFARYEGFREVRPVPYRPGIAFVEYEAETGAISAKEATAGMPLGEEGQPMKVTFQRS